MPRADSLGGFPRMFREELPQGFIHGRHIGKGLGDVGV
jgi:hypothetical protein